MSTLPDLTADPRTVRQPFVGARRRVGDAAAVVVGCFLVLALLPGGLPSLDLRDAAAPAFGQVADPTGESAVSVGLSREHPRTPGPQAATASAGR